MSRRSTDEFQQEAKIFFGFLVFEEERNFGIQVEVLLSRGKNQKN